MFRRKWSGLPEEAHFEPDLGKLGYNVNDEDEIRSITDPDKYFKYFLTKNERVNHRQRFAFNQAVEDMIHGRLEALGLEKHYLPLDASEGPRMPIFASKDVHEASRVVVIFGETTQDLGVLAHRVISGEGGIDQGSMVCVVRELRSQQRSAHNERPPGVVLANTGQTYFWPEEQRCLTVAASAAVPLPSLVHSGRKHVPAENEVPQNEDPARHIDYMFKTALQHLVALGTDVNIIAIGDACEMVQKTLDREDVWDSWKGMTHAMVLIDGTCLADQLQNEDFKTFLAEQARSYVRDKEVVGTPLAGPDGNEALGIPPLGTPVYSSSEVRYTELALIKCLDHALDYLKDKALDPDATDRVLDILEAPPTPSGQDAEAYAKDYKEARDSIDVFFVSDEEMERREKEMKIWKKFAEVGTAALDEEDPDEALEVEEVVRTGDASKMDDW